VIPLRMTIDAQEQESPPAAAAGSEQTTPNPSPRSPPQGPAATAAGDSEPKPRRGRPPGSRTKKRGRGRGRDRVRVRTESAGARDDDDAVKGEVVDAADDDEKTDAADDAETEAEAAEAKRQRIREFTGLVEQMAQAPAMLMLAGCEMLVPGIARAPIDACRLNAQGKPEMYRTSIALAARRAFAELAASSPTIVKAASDPLFPAKATVSAITVMTCIAFLDRLAGGPKQTYDAPAETPPNGASNGAATSTN